MVKLCSKCKVERPLTEFRKRSNKLYLQSWCKVCSRIAAKNANKKARIKNPLKAYQESRDSQLKSYGLNGYMFHILLQMQDYRCAICKIEYENVTKDFAVDHCHKTQVVRGLLCTSCNTGIGLLDENPQIINQALKYLGAA